MTSPAPSAGATPAGATHGAPTLARIRDLARRWRRYTALTGVLLVIPFGSYGELQRRIVDGSLTKSVPQGRFIVNPIDDPGTVSWRVSALKRTPPARPTVYLLGGSSMRECIPSADTLNAALAARQDTPTTVRMLACTNETYAQYLAIIDNLPKAEGGIVVLAVHHAQFKVPRTEALLQLKGVELMMKSPALRDFLERRLDKDLSNNLRQGLEDHLTAYRFARGVEPFRGSSIAYRLHRYTVDDRWRDSSKKNWLTMWLREYGKPGGAFDTYFGFNAACLTEAVRVARAKGYQVVLMRCPENTFIIGDALDRFKEKYTALMDKLVAEQDAHAVDPNAKAGLVNADFRDLYHLIGQGRTKWQRALADGLAPVLIDHFGATPSPSPSPSETQSDPASPSPAGSGSAAQARTDAADGLAGLLDLVARELAATRP